MANLVYDNPFAVYKLGSAASFRPEWDVPSINEVVSDRVGQAINEVRDRDHVDDAQKILLLLGAPGYGKTHLFGRIRHRQHRKVQFVFVPQIIDARRPGAHIRWHLVESLFEAEPGCVPPLLGLVGRLLRPSFKAYFDGLPPAVAARHQSLRQRLEQDPLAAVEVIKPVTDMLSFHRLADSLAANFPGLPADVLRALVLGLSPAAHEARCWLRGDTLPEPRLADLRLMQETPSATAVLNSLAVLLQRLRVPVVLCLDQLEAVLKDEQGPKELASELMGYLDDVPNLLLAMSCLKGEWDKLKNSAYESFPHRITPLDLDPITPAQARELVSRRMKSWAEYKPGRGETWPFEAGSIDHFTQKNPLNARAFIQECGKRFGVWLDDRPDSLIALEKDKQPPPPAEELFLQQWDQELLAIQQGRLSPQNYQEERLSKGVREALEVAREGKLVVGGVQVLSTQSPALAPTKNDPRPSLEVRLGKGASAFSVVVAVTRNDSGQRFGYYFRALEDAMGGQVVGAVLVRPAGQLNLGAGTDARKKYNKAVNEKRLRPFDLEGDQKTFELLECLVRFQEHAESKLLQLAGKTLSPLDCRQMVIQLKLLDNLKLFDLIFAGWTAGQASEVEAPVAAPVEAVPTAVGSAAGPACLPAGGPTPAKEKSALGTIPGPAWAKPEGNGVPSSPRPSPAAAEGPQAWGQQMLAKVVEQLCIWKQPVDPLGIEIGPSFARLKVLPKNQTDVSKVRKKAENLQISLDLATRPVIDAQAGYISIDVQRPDRQAVTLADVLASPGGALEGQPVFPVGMDVSGHTHWLNLADPSSCHLLIAGTTGSGKSEFMKALLATLARRLGPDQLQFVLIDPKQVTFNLPGSSPYLRDPIAHDLSEALPLIERAFKEMERRYTLLKERHKENVSELTGPDALPRIVLIFDEFADLMLDKASKKELETLLKRIGAKARAAGIHLVLGTQRTEASIVTPLLRSNLPGRISLRVISAKDSKLILDAPDAAHLLGKGDLLWLQGGGLLRLQSPFVTRAELEESLRIA